MFLEFDFRGVPTITNTPILTFDFHPSQDRGALGPSGCAESKSCKNKKQLAPDFRGVRFN